jgi:Ulp1 family protease
MAKQLFINNLVSINLCIFTLSLLINNNIRFVILDLGHSDKGHHHIKITPNQIVQAISSNEDVVLTTEESKTLCNYKLSELQMKEMQDILEDSKIAEYEIIIDRFAIPLSYKDFKCLKSCVWLNDNVINFYINMLDSYMKRKGENNLYLQTQFIQKLYENNEYSFDRLKITWGRKTQKENIGDYGKIFVPIHAGENHWVLILINVTGKEMTFYDSIKMSEDRYSKIYFPVVQQWMRDKGYKYDSNWKQTIIDCPRQVGFNDCGIFMLACMDCLSNETNLLYSQNDVDVLRLKIASSIKNGRLLYIEEEVTSIDQDG